LRVYITAVREPADGIRCLGLSKGISNGLNQGVQRAGLDLPQVRLHLRPELLDGVQVRAIRREEPQVRPRGANGLPDVGKPGGNLGTLPMFSPLSSAAGGRVFLGRPPLRGARKRPLSSSSRAANAPSPAGRSGRIVGVGVDHAALVGGGEGAAEAVVGGEGRRVDPGEGYHVGFPGLRHRSFRRRQITPARGAGQRKSTERQRRNPQMTQIGTDERREPG